MDLTPEAAASFLEDYARRLHGMASLKWTGEFGSDTGVEARLLKIAAGLRRDASGPPSGEDDAGFLRGQAEALRSPNKLVLDDPMVTAEWRQASETAFETAERLDAIADMITRRSQ
jgi:hypothetical protein